MLEQEENTDNLESQGIDTEMSNIAEQVSNLNLTNSAQEPYNSNQEFEGYIPFQETPENAFVTQNLITGDPYNTQIPPPTYQPLGDLASMSEEEKKSRQQQYVASLKQSLNNELVNFQDPNQWGGIYKYNAGPNSTTYWDRYHNLWGDGDHELDFHPLHNNEAAYNMATSYGERAAYSLYGMSQLALAGFIGTYESLGAMAEGDFWKPDYRVGREFDRVNKLYYDSNDGTGAFVNNLVMNFGYTLGIMGSIALDGGFASAFKLGAAGRYVPNIRSAKTLSNIQKANKLDNAVDGARITQQNLDYLSGMGNARKWYQGWDLRRLSESTIGRAVNPFSNVTANRYRILDGADNLTGLAEGAMGFGAFYRDIRNINLAIAESRLESSLNRDRLFDNLYSNYYKNNGKAPLGEDLERIMSAADAEAFETSIWNTALIYFTNKLAFDNILNPTALNKVFGKKINDIASIGKGDFGPIGRVTLESGKGAVFRERGYRTWLHGWKTDPIAKSLGNTIGYFKVNLLEGLQESFQQVIADATYEHYKKLYYSDPTRKGIIDKAIFGQGSTSVDEYTRALKKQISPEGAEVFGSGFFMGFLTKGLGAGINAARTRSAKMYDPQGYKDYLEFETQVGQQLADRINDIGVKDFWDSGYFNAATQLGVNTVTKSGDIKENRDAEMEAVISHVKYLKKNGILDSYIENFKTYQDLTDEEFLEANPTVTADEVGKYKSKIPIIAEKLKKVSKTIDRVEEKYKNPVDIRNMESWMEGYEDAVFMHNAWEEAVTQAAFFQENWEDVSKRMVSIQKTHYNNRPSESLSKSDSDLILTIRDSRGMKAEIARLKDEIKTLTTQATPESKEAAKQRQKRLNALEDYYNNWKSFDDFFHRDRYRAGLKQYLQKENKTTEAEKEEAPVEKPRYSDSKVPVGRKTFTITDPVEGTTNTYRYKVNLDGSIRDFQILKDGNYQNTDIFGKRTYEQIKEVFEKEGDVVEIIKEEDYKAIMNPKMFDRLTTDQQQRVDAERAKTKTKGVTEEEVDKILDRELGKKTVKEEGKIINKLKNSYKNLLNELGTETDFIFDDKASEGFRDVIDYYKLSDEKAELAKLINLVNDPQGFYKLYEKNLEWMQKLYNERGAYATEIAKRELNDIAGNGLLNTLAEDGIFMSGADFIAWKDHGIAPTEFYDEVNQLIITEDNPVFNRYMNKLYLYQAYVEKNEELDEGSKYREYKAKKKAIEQKRLVQIQKEKQAFKSRNGISVEEFEKQNTKEVPTDKKLQAELDKLKSLKEKTESYKDPLNFGKDIISEIGLESNQFDEFVSTVDQSDPEVQKLITKYGKQAKLGAGISKEDKASIQNDFGLYKYSALDIIDQTIEEIESQMETEIVSEFDKTPEGKVYTKAINTIDESYSKALKEIEASYTEEEKKPPVIKPTSERKEPVEKKIDSDRTTVKWDTLDQELKDILTTQFELYLDAKGMSEKANEDVEYLRLRNNWLKNNRDIIAKYNAEQEAKKPKTVEEVEVPTLKTLDGTVPSKLKQLDALVNVLNNDLKKAKTDARKEDIQSDINALTKYREDLSELKRPQSPSERNWRLFEAMVLGKQNQVERVIGENGETIGYRFTGSTPETPAPTRSTQYAEQLKNKKFKLSAFEYGPVKEKNYNKKTGKTSRGGLLNLFDSIDKMDLSQQEKIDTLVQSISADKTYSQLQEPGKLATIKTALEANFTLDSLKKVINRVAFRESNIAGNTVDAMFRAGLTLDEDGNFIKPTKPDNMSDEAFDSINAIITELQDWAKDGDYFFYVGDALVFDQTAMENGVVGAMDIFAFNRKTKEFHVIDIKTSKDFENFSESKLYQYSAQQSIYRNLVHNMMGTLPSKLSLLLIQLDINLDGYINSAKKAGEELNKERIDKLKLEKKKANKARKEEIDAQIKSIQNNIAVDIPYIEDVEAGVPLVKPTDVPVELQAPVTEEGESFDPFLTEEIKEKLDSGVADQIEELAQKIREAKDINEADAARMEAILLVVQEPALGEQLTKMLQEEVDAKRKALENVISPKDLSKGDYLVSENPIFDVGGNIVEVTKVYKKGDVDMVTVKSIGLKSRKQKSMPVSEANEKFDKATATDAKESIKVSKEAKAAAKKSQQNQKEVNASTSVAENNEGTGLSGLADKLKNYTKKNPKEDC